MRETFSVTAEYGGPDHQPCSLPDVDLTFCVVTSTVSCCPRLVCRSVSGQTLTDRLFSSLSGGELFERITAEGYTMSEAEVINYMRQICEGVKHMHERNIIHLGNYFVQ